LIANADAAGESCLKIQSFLERCAAATPSMMTLDMAASAGGDSMEGRNSETEIPLDGS